MTRHFIGIDPASKCGFAVLDATGARVASGTWDCRVRRGEGAGFRYVRFERAFRELLAAYPRAPVAYEEVRHHAGTEAAHIYGALVGHLQRVCEQRKPPRPYVGVPVKTIKHAATGKGNADKPAMVSAARERWEVEVEDDNEADALFIAYCLLTERA